MSPNLHSVASENNTHQVNTEICFDFKEVVVGLIHLKGDDTILEITLSLSLSVHAQIKRTRLGKGDNVGISAYLVLAPFLFTATSQTTCRKCVFRYPRESPFVEIFLSSVTIKRTRQDEGR